MNQTNVVDNANKAVFKHNLSEYQTELNTYVARQIASGNYIEKEDIYAEGQELKTIIPSVKDSDIDKIKIEGGSLVYVGTDENEITWARESQGVTVKPGGEDDPNEPETPTTKKKGKIEFAVKNYSKKVGDANFTNPLTKTGDGTVTYSSSNTGVATVSSLGEVTIVNEGTTTITATVADGEQYEYETKTASYGVFVSANEKTISYSSSDYTGPYDTNPHSITLNVTDPASGYTVMYGTQEGTYNLSSAPTLTNPGTQNVYFEITASGYTPVRGSSRINITKANGSISYASQSINKTYGDTSFTNTLTKTGDGNVTYTSSNTGVATVNENGEVSIVKPGTTTITATVTDGTNYTYQATTASYTLNVAKAEGSITLGETNGTISYPNTATVSVTNPNNAEITVTSADSTVATGTVEGNVLTVTSKRKAGTATITVTANANDYYTEKSATYDVEVLLDIVAPTCTITANKPDTTNAASVTYTFSWSEKVVGFTEDSVTVTNGSKGLFTKNSDTEYTLVVTNTGSTTQTVTVATGACTDVAENENEVASKTITIDRTLPTITSITTTNSNPTNSTTITYVITMSENVVVNDGSKITVTSGTKGTPSISGNTVTIEVTNVNGNETHTLEVEAGAFVDSAGNENVDSDSATTAVDTTAPTITSIVT
ncbi:MAG: Ig-like domain-containing protein, partial [Clostridia bacterium]|nr:Ig-like domain-containing protein [Clostridia bacterium]